MLKIPAFFFPTTVIILDDDKHFSQLLKMMLGEYFHIHTFSTPEEIEPYIHKNAVYMDTTVPNHFPLSTPNTVKSFLESGRSHNLVSIWITDYQLEHKTGIEVLEKLNPPFVQRILMSNFVDQTIVNSAYKYKTINAYLPKLDNEFIDKLKNTIQEMQEQFFVSYCEQMYELPLRRSKLCDQTFANFAKKIIKKYEITQMVGSKDLNLFQLESETKREKINLSVAEDQDFEDFINSMHGETVSPTVLSRLQQRLAIPCFPSGKIPDGSLWAEYMKPVTVLRGEKSYYISCHTKNEGISLHAI
jgi:CheY-like chemotaxis protein